MCVYEYIICILYSFFWCNFCCYYKVSSKESLAKSGPAFQGNEQQNMATMMTGEWPDALK